MWNRDRTRREYKVCDSITGAIENWVKYGLPPGSCTEFLLRGDYERARLSAHMLIRYPDEVWTEHVLFVQNCVPEYCRGENYDTWKGMENYKMEQRLKDFTEAGVFDND